MRLSLIFQDPLELGNQLGVEHGAKEVQMEFMHGTTTLGFKYQGGVVLAVDSRATGKCQLRSRLVLINVRIFPI